MKENNDRVHNEGLSEKVEGTLLFWFKFIMLKIELYSPAIPLLGINPKKMKQDIEEMSACLVLCSIIHNIQNIK